MNNKTQPLMVLMILLAVLATFFSYQGIQMHMNVVEKEAKFHALQSAYFNVEKSARDTALENSDLSMQLVEIKNYPSELLTLKLLGIGKILTGIFMLLFGILIALVSIPFRLSFLLKEHQTS